jgi:Mis12 protein
MDPDVSSRIAASLTFSTTDMYLYEMETTYFQFFPLLFVDRVINAMNEFIYSATEKFLTILQSSSDMSQVSVFQVEEVSVYK